MQEKRKSSELWWEGAFALACVLLLLATNRWMGWEAGIKFLFAQDVVDSYQPIAEAAPGWPQGLVPFHKAQRFFLPYLVGELARVTGFSLASSFRLVLFSLQGFLLGGIFFLLRNLEVPPRRRLLAFAAFALQVYAVRYYWIVPGMANDVLFELGLLVVILGLSRASLFFLVLGLGLAGLARQSVVLLLPALLFFSFLGEFRRGWLWRVFFFAVSVLCAFGIYGATGHLARSFAGPSNNAEHLLGILHWLGSAGFSWRALGEHVLRCALPLLPVFFLCVAECARPRKRLPLALALMALAIVAQPFLAGPEITGQNAARLVSLGLLPAVLAWACWAPRELRPRELKLMVCWLVVGSFHHMYTILGPSGPGGTVALQALAAIGMGGVVWRYARGAALEKQSLGSARPSANEVGRG